MYVDLLSVKFAELNLVEILDLQKRVYNEVLSEDESI